MTKKLHLTQKQAIKECKELWAKAEEVGVGIKYDIISDYFPEFSHYLTYCPLCEYSSQFNDFCAHCPLIKKYNRICDVLGYSIYIKHCTPEWFESIRNL